ncbi:MAG TPA: hypothetical protein VGQ03_00470, partial [Nitrososphaera sp.]|nr:hypothetical protein [Nitrososphaera sp.]
FRPAFYLSPNQEIRLRFTGMLLVDWKDFLSLFCLAMTVLAAAALVTAAQNFVIVRGMVVSTGVAVIDGEDGSIPTRTVTVVIENSDRVFRIERGTTVEYAVSDEDAGLVEIGSEVELMISSHQVKARVLSVEGRSGL